MNKETLYLRDMHGTPNGLRLEFKILIEENPNEYNIAAII